MQAKDILAKVANNQNLNRDEARSFLGFVMKGEVSDILLSSFITAMKCKGETGEELLGFAQAMRKNAVQPKSARWEGDVLDTCGTGGDGKGSINVSTLSALTLASMGVKVAKHGNRSVSSVSGSSDLLGSLGYPVEDSHENVEKFFLEKGFCFLYAPAWHPAMKYAGGVRKELGFRSFFNAIGPLSNPFSPSHQIIGIFSKEWLDRMAFCLLELGLKAGIVCHSRDGLDEFSVFAPTDFILIQDGRLENAVLDPDSLGLPSKLVPEEVYVSSSEKATEFSRNILEGTESTGTHLVALNAGVALWLVKKVDSIKHGYRAALDQLLNKKVAQYTTEILLLK